MPLLIVAPGVTRPNQRVDRAGSAADLYPTPLAELCGLPPRSVQLEGASLVPQLKEPGRAAGPNRRS